MNVLAGALSDTYSREEAILDGQLVDVSETAAKLAIAVRSRLLRHCGISILTTHRNSLKKPNNDACGTCCGFSGLRFYP